MSFTPPDKSKTGEVTGYRTSAQRERDGRFKDLALSVIEESGPNWSIHGLSVMKRNTIARVIYYHDLYQKCLTVPGVICEFGVHWGAGLSTLLNLRSILEPYNHSRHIFGFDTFEGFANAEAKDGDVRDGDYASRADFADSLAEILNYHESIAPFPEVKKHTLVKGSVVETVPVWLEQNPHVSIALAIFDMDLYAPTKFTLERILDRMPKGALLVFDEFNCPFFPGETQAVQEVLGLRNVRLQRHPLQTYCAFCEI
ncbi:TylF/MycF/NovP-related O-methyltransferase [Methylorubrum thiocyanatum]